MKGSLRMMKKEKVKVNIFKSGIGRKILAMQELSSLHFVSCWPSWLFTLYFQHFFMTWYPKR